MDLDKAWHTLSIEATAASLETDLDHGLTEAQVRQRRERFGPNQLREGPPRTFWQMLLDQFNQFLVLILIAAAVVSALIGWSEFNRTGEMTEFIDAAAIMTIVILNAILGVVQEGRAEEALAALKKMAAPNAQVLRNGHRVTVPSVELVPGDVVILETGNYIPADVRLVESVNLRVEEASLTGESVPVGKDARDTLPPDASLGDRHNMAFMSTVVTYGRGSGLVTGTGMQTQIGAIAEMIQSYEEEQTPLQVKLDNLGRTLGILTLIVSALVGIIGIVRDTQVGVLFSQGPGAYFGLEETVPNLVEMFMVAVSLAIAAVPEGLAAVVTICLALGMQEMVKRHALIRRLPAVETLGSATAICSDKTGTLTQNQMTAVQMYVDRSLLNITGEGYRPEGEFLDSGDQVGLAGYPGMRLLLRAGLLANDARLEHVDENGDVHWRIAGDPTEGAFVVAAAKAGYWKDELGKEYPRLEEIPFDSDRKRMTTFHPDPRYGGYVAYMKGAPDIVLDLSTHILEDGTIRPLTNERRSNVLEVNQALAGNALRVLGVAFRPLDVVPANPQPDAWECDMVFIGLLGMIDPARPEVAPAIRTARHAGIETVMITGDYPNTAVAIAKEIGLLQEGDVALTGAELERIDDDAFLDVVENVAVYARVSPQHKVRIVDALKSRGHIVAMTGDGVNDAPALKRSNIGVAMGITGTDVSKETADMVLTDDNYASIVSAIEQGRIIYSNIRKFVYYLLSCNMAEITILFLSMLAGWPLPLIPIQLLVLNLITDGAPALALGVEKGDPDIMDVKPRPVAEPIINREMVIGIVVQTIAITAAVLVAFRIGLANGEDHGRTMAFATLSISELLRAYTSRSERYSIFAIGVFSNKWMQWAVLASLIVLMAIIYVPFLDPVFGTTFLTLEDWAIMLPLILLPSVAAEINKWVLRRLAAQERATRLGT
ncbi:MAG TPA: cation-translocating P-type ATPase [Anaerolineae bacterium]|nr:cation-translocating P-type ATPase [Anaerolineae bacterium]